MPVMRRVGWVLACTALSMSLGGPALATHSAEHASEQIDQIVADATQEMRSRVATFEAQVESATSEGEIESLRKGTRSDVHAISASAETRVKETAKGYDNELGSKVAEAKQGLLQARNDAFADIEEAARAARESLPPPTTAATTTTVPPTPTTEPQTSTTTQPGVTTSTPDGGVPPDVGAPPPPGQTPLDLWTAQAFVSGLTQPSNDDAGRASALSVALETVLPRDLIDWVMSPFRILSIIAGTIMDGGRAVLYPTAALALSTVILGAIEARFRHRHRAASRRMASSG